MHVHLPKPRHGWRAFVGEVDIIVLGVLIALGFGQVVEQWQWHAEVSTTRRALANELATAAQQPNSWADEGPSPACGPRPFFKGLQRGDR